MDFAFTREQEMLRNMVREYAEQEIAPKIPSYEEPGDDFPMEFPRRMGELGLIGLIAPTEYGGSDLGHMAQVITTEEISRVYATFGSQTRGFMLVTYLISKYGTEAQKKKYLPGLCRGELQGCMTLTEPSGGSDMLGITTVAEKGDSHYIVNGRKTMISRYTVCDVFAITTKTGERAITTFLVDKGSPGLELGRREYFIAATTRAYPVGEVIFNNCQVPVENRIGEEGRGLGPVLSTVGAIGRVGGAAICLGIAQSSFEAAVKYAKERHLYGKPLTELQTLRFWLAEMDIRIRAARLCLYQAAWLLDQGKSPREVAKETCGAKYLCSKTAIDVTLKAIELHGGYGTADDYSLIRQFKTALDCINAAGSDQVMLQTVSNEIVGSGVGGG